MRHPRAPAPAQAAVEFALAIPILLMLLMGVLDVGRGALAATSLTNAVREGARAGAVAYPASGWDTTAISRVRSTAFTLDSSLLDVTATTTTTGSTTRVVLNATYHFRLLAPFITAAVSDIPLSAGTRMLVR